MADRRCHQANKGGEVMPTLEPGTMVFWAGQPIPWWVVEWQPENGEGAYWLVDANGAWGSAAANELHTKPARTWVGG